MLTTQHAAEWITAKRCSWLTPSAVLGHPAMRARLAAYVAAGPNRMARLEMRPGAGWAGAAAVFDNLYSARGARMIAGDYFRAARERRALGEPADDLIAAALHHRDLARERARIEPRKG